MKKQSTQQWIQHGILAVVIICVVTYFFMMRGWELSSFMKAELHAQKGMIPIHSEKLDNGATIAIVPLTELPMVDILLWFDAGSARDGAQWGVSNLTARLIGEDTTTLSAQKIHDAFESVGAQFDANSSRDVFAIHLRTLSDGSALDPSTQMLETLLHETAFKPDTVAREKSRVLADIQSKLDSPGQTTADTFFMKAYGDHPYAHPVTGVTQTVTPLTADNLQAFYQQQIVQSRATVVIVGDISPRAGSKLAKRLLAALPVGTPAAPLSQPVLQAQSTHKITFASTQTHLMFGLPAIEKGNPDFYSLTLGNTILGGPFTSRLFSVVREKEGLAYNVSSQLMPLRVPGPFLVYLQTRTSEAAKALEISRATLANFMSIGPTEEELAAAKKNVNGTFLLSLSGNSAIASHVATLGFYGLPWDYADQFQAKINAVKREEVITAFQKYIHPNHLTEIVLGNDK
ncbi:MAG: M16 family metallopeptidase [Gammaproteobacteria bacterium]